VFVWNQIGIIFVEQGFSYGVYSLSLSW
jgi:hypothetical protein